jgi:hypothetical protein
MTMMQRNHTVPATVPLPHGVHRVRTRWTRLADLALDGMLVLRVVSRPCS